MAMGNLSVASPVGVLPKMSFTTFQETRIFPGISQLQHDGRTISSLIIDGVNPATSIKSWALGARLCHVTRAVHPFTTETLSAMRTFYESHFGPLIPFYFYNPFEASPGSAVGSNWDGSGSGSQGRYTVRFANDSWLETIGMTRSDIMFSLTEAA